MNPCPCGNYGDAAASCICAPINVIRYRKKISGPLLDRLDLHVEVPAVCFDSLADDTRGESTASVRARVLRARSIQAERLAPWPGVFANAQMDVSLLRRFAQPSAGVARLLQGAVERGLSARAYHRVLKVARTIADLDSSPEISPSHILEAISYRPKQSQY